MVPNGSKGEKSQTTTDLMVTLNMTLCWLTLKLCYHAQSTFSAVNVV